MVKFKCSNCSFSFSEADKVWDKAIKNARCPKCKIFNQALDFENKFRINPPTLPQEVKVQKKTFYKRLIISILCWASSFIAIGVSGRLVVLGVKDAFLFKEFENSFLVLIFLYPWLALLIMNIGWIKNRRVNLFWPYSGTALALCAVVISFGSALILAPLCILLAIWLVIYHLRLGGWNDE